MGQVSRIAIEDSTGFIVYSSNVADLYDQFRRPPDAEEVQPSVFRYTLDGVGSVFEFYEPDHNSGNMLCSLARHIFCFQPTLLKIKFQPNV